MNQSIALGITLIAIPTICGCALAVQAISNVEVIDALKAIGQIAVVFCGITMFAYGVLLITDESEEV